MKNPQTLAERLYEHFPNKKLKAIKDYACCAFTLLWCLGLEPEDPDAIISISKLMDKGILETNKKGGPALPDHHKRRQT